MNISPSVKNAMWIIAGIGTFIGTVKSLSDIAKNLNGWHVLAILSFAFLCVLGVDTCRQWLNGRFTKLETQLADGLRRESDSRGGMHSTACAMIDGLTKRIEKLETNKREPDFIRPDRG